MNVRIKDINPVLIHGLLGGIIGIFIFHPVTMVIYWFEFNQVSITLNEVVNVALERISHSFHPHMLTMSVSFAFLGAMTGLGSGLYYKTLKKKNETIKQQNNLLKKGIVAIINEGENEKVEFKSTLRYDFKRGNVNKDLEHVILKSIAGFLNNKGGLLIIGVEDDGRIIGLANDYFSLKRKNKDGFEQRVIQLIAGRLGGDLSPLISIVFHSVADYEICSISIEHSPRPVYINEGELTVFYLRSGNTTKPLTTQETVNYLESKKHQV